MVRFHRTFFLVLIFNFTLLHQTIIRISAYDINTLCARVKNEKKPLRIKGFLSMTCSGLEPLTPTLSR
jgi:hypothetical protein